MFFVYFRGFSQFGPETRQETVSAEVRKTDGNHEYVADFRCFSGIGSFGPEQELIVNSGSQWHRRP